MDNIHVNISDDESESKETDIEIDNNMDNIHVNISNDESESEENDIEIEEETEPEPELEQQEVLQKKIKKEHRNTPSASSVPSNELVLDVNQLLSSKHKKEKGTHESEKKSEFDEYLCDECEQNDKTFEILQFWKDQKKRYPILTMMALDVLAMPSFYGLHDLTLEQPTIAIDESMVQSDDI
ncbi:hypothetical protein Cgig2_000765 [Carnegiea gigantea]|uniref:HAT C-terminal dimerisation domain-containing protein n=1 Tax=Carnegiea gigantea TaxID=171969 RepID=A0A9Q1KPW1_9CARY|nr:hypothetical protein Cgig2_000765 [Carnegiea gigantea]